METMEKNSFTRNPPDKEREINKRGKKYKQILSKNEFRTKAEKEKGKEMEKRTKRIDMANTEKRKEKTGETVQLLNYQLKPLPSLRNKTNARQKTIKTTEMKAKAER